MQLCETAKLGQRLCGAVQLTHMTAIPGMTSYPPLSPYHHRQCLSNSIGVGFIMLAQIDIDIIALPIHLAIPTMFPKCHHSY